jgi:hypothetical protein
MIDASFAAASRGNVAANGNPKNAAANVAKAGAIRMPNMRE